jgi:transcriptional regulator with PAS, ATPase and Fis domain
MSLALQAKLLRALQFQEVRRVGGTEVRQVDVRFVFATHHDLWEKVRQGVFRADLLYRMEVLTMHLPPLRERKEDLPLFAAHAVGKIGRKLGLPVKRVSDAALRVLQAYEWPGNLRELENVLEQAVVLDEDGVIEPEDLPKRLVGESGGMTEWVGDAGVLPTLEEVEERLIREALRRFSSKQEAAKALGVSRATLYRKLERFGIS